MMPKMTVNGVNIDYEDQGSGTPIVLAHGFGGTKDSWQQVTPGLLKHHRVITMSHRGMGESEEPEDGNYSLQAMADDIHALLKELKVQKPVLVGHSMGGYIVQTYYFSYPDECKGLVLYGTLCDASPAFAVGPSASQSVEAIQTRGWKAQLNEFLSYWLSPDAGPELRERVRKEALRTSDEVAAALWREIPKFNVSHRLHEIGVPTLLIVGSEDPRTTVSDHERMNREIPDSWLKIIKGPRHYVHAERPEEFTQALLAFMQVVD